jgi:uncharacterized protein YcaQ
MPGKPKILPIKTIRALALDAQRLLAANPGKGKKGALAVIDHLGYVQIDTLAVIARAHHHILQTRLPDYNESYLNGLMEKDRSVFEYWSHAASYLPMKDYRFSLPRKKLFAEGKSHWFAQDKKTMKHVLDRIRAEGPLQSKDFEYKRSGPGNWYEWKPAKKALEQLFMDGTLMVAKRQGFQKVYDLAENVLPSDVDTRMPTEGEYAEYLIRKSIEANGVVEEKEIAYLRRGLKESVNKVLKKLLKSGEYTEVLAEGCGSSLFIAGSAHLKAGDKIKTGNEIHFLSPFDNLVIQRKRLQRFFNFDYQIECYVPEPKRRFGYFCLPVLYGDEFIGRFDPKADRASKTFHIRSMHFEKGFKPDRNFNQAFAEKLVGFATFNGCDKIVIDKAEKNWKKEVTSYLK